MTTKLNQSAGKSAKISTPNATPVSGETPIKPKVFRLPKPTMVDPYFNGSRTFWNERILPCKANEGKPPIKSIVFKQRGSKRGIRFIDYASAEAYFAKILAEQNQEVTTE